MGVVVETMLAGCRARGWLAAWSRECDGECFPSFTARPETVLYQRSTDCAADVSMRYLPSLRRYAYVRLYGLWLEREPVSRAGLLGVGRVLVIVIVR